jgi:hypothetical protein
MFMQRNVEVPSSHRPRMRTPKDFAQAITAGEKHSPTIPAMIGTLRPYLSASQPAKKGV